jgi:hypothetical protein
MVPAAHGRGVVVEALLCGVLLETGSADERLVEDDGSVLVLTATGNAVCRAVRWPSSWPAHTLRLGLRGVR